MNGKSVSLVLFITGMMVITFMYITGGEFMNILNDIIPTVTTVTNLESIVLRMIFPLIAFILVIWLVIRFGKRKND